MDDIDIRVAMTCFATRDRVKELMLSDGDLEIIDLVSCGYNTSGSISLLKNSSVQTISSRMARLRSKGYLTRNEVVSKSGGVEFEYKSIYLLR